MPLLAIATWLATSKHDGTPELVEIATAHPTTPKAPVKNAAALEPLIAREQLFPKRTQGRRPDLFAAASWLPPRAPAADIVPVPLPPPVSDFSYIGRQYDGSQWEIYLTHADRTYIAKLGTVLDERYRVESITASEIVIRSLQNDSEQSLSIGEAP
jgi:hypothetical protein